jgi:hypothetical protein
MPNNDNFIKDIDDVVSNIESSTNIEVPEGCNITFIPQEEYEAKLQNKKNQSDALIEKNKKANNMREYLKDNEFGRYFHMIYKYNQPMFEKLRKTVPQSKVKVTMVRFTTLVAYISLYGKVKKSMLTEIWDTANRNGINETYKFLLDCGFIQETEDGFITINEDIAREKIKDYIKELHKEDKSYTYTRVFCESILNLYNEMESRKRQQLSNLYAILPYINFKYNRLCKNPTEIDNHKLEYLGWSDLCDICEYDKSNFHKLRKDLMKLKINGQYVLMDTIRGENVNVIIVNPRIYYAGDNVNELKAIMDLFDDFETDK